MGTERNRVAAWHLLACLAAAFAWWWAESRFDLAEPRMLWLLAAVPLIAAWSVWRDGRRHPRVRLSTLNALQHITPDLPTLLRPVPQALALAGFALLAIAMARPQSRDDWQDVVREGIDIVIAMDVSGSMLARDLKPDRLEASKSVAMQFIDQRPSDRIGLVVYEGEAFTQCPLTTDHDVLKDMFGNVRSGLIQGGTAIGMGLATALNRLRESEAKSRVVILLTDGMNNAGNVQPLDAARIAEQMGVRVYTIGVGTRGKALSPVAIYPNGQYRFDHVEVEIDEPLLEQVASMTDGRYFRATDEKKLAEIYQEIDQLERTRIKVTEHSRRNEEYLPLVLLGGLALTIGLVLEKGVLRLMA